ncbi:uncharacterized protein LY89DRAFT_732199 [Mollisia scopiformis]|uniref:Uncharacterized protein n=1 Tax=Mollisia scopiformis TaxID=149040 RepID=A0A194XEP2_MOLSC|nr:uncharacterized protein LY89DRAFT_732199 [Mollisia scopiformis]KUJ18643.1 hypothetical protein LY89DRAFT_732199 [Mollisia scopiformis]
MSSEGLYYVYAKYTNQKATGYDYANSSYGRYLCVFRNRWEADEFWRFMATWQYSKGTNFFSYLNRNGPQFWQFNGTNAQDSFMSILQYAQPQGQNIMCTRITTYTNEAGCLALPQQATVDWTNGCAVFIRNKLNPAEYWHLDGSSIQVTNSTYRTKFVIRGTNFAAGDTTVLNRSDPITIELASNAGGSNPQYLGLVTADARLVTTSSPYNWSFGDFFVSFGQKTLNNDAGTAEHMVVRDQAGKAVS